MEDRSRTLTSDHAASGEAAAIACEFHVIDHWNIACAGEQEITMQRMTDAIRCNRLRRCFQPLTKDLSAEQRTIDVDLVRLAAEQIGVELFQLQYFTQEFRGRRRSAHQWGSRTGGRD